MCGLNWAHEIFFSSKAVAILKEKLKKFIVRIVREKYRKRTTVKGIFKDEKDQFYSELFAYLTDEVKLAMDEFVFYSSRHCFNHSYDVIMNKKKSFFAFHRFRGYSRRVLDCVVALRNEFRFCAGLYFLSSLGHPQSFFL